MEYSEGPCQPAEAVSGAALPPGSAPPALDVRTGSASTTVVVPAVLERDAFDFRLRELTHELQPVGYLETQIVRDLARHLSEMEVWNEALAALLRQRTRHLPDFVVPEGGDDDGEWDDALLAAAVSAAEIHLSEQHSRARSRAFYRALRTLRELQAQRRQRESVGVPVVPHARFPTEAACERYLKERFERGHHQCPNCGCRRGHYIRTRRSWECAECKRQTGLRAGTVAADSPLPLVTWFAAIRWILRNPNIAANDLGTKLGITRLTTVRNMAKKILAAMAEDNAGERLAGLDVHFARLTTFTPDVGAPEAKRQTVVPQMSKRTRKGRQVPAD